MESLVNLNAYIGLYNTIFDSIEVLVVKAKLPSFKTI